MLPDAEDANLVTSLKERESQEAADAFGATPESHAVGRRAGVASDPEATVFTRFERTGRCWGLPHQCLRRICTATGFAPPPQPARPQARV